MRLWSESIRHLTVTVLPSRPFSISGLLTAHSVSRSVTKERPSLLILPETVRDLVGVEFATAWSDGRGRSCDRASPEVSKPRNATVQSDLLKLDLLIADPLWRRRCNPTGASLRILYASANAKFLSSRLKEPGQVA